MFILGSLVLLITKKFIFPPTSITPSLSSSLSSKYSNKFLAWLKSLFNCTKRRHDAMNRVNVKISVNFTASIANPPFQDYFSIPYHFKQKISIVSWTMSGRRSPRRCAMLFLFFLDLPLYLPLSKALSFSRVLFRSVFYQFSKICILSPGRQLDS